jgi:hypothetical protein
VVPHLLLLPRPLLWQRILSPLRPLLLLLLGRRLRLLTSVSVRGRLPWALGRRRVAWLLQAQLNRRPRGAICCAGRWQLQLRCSFLLPGADRRRSSPLSKPVVLRPESTGRSAQRQLRLP